MFSDLRVFFMPKSGGGFHHTSISAIISPIAPSDCRGLFERDLGNVSKQGFGVNGALGGMKILGSLLPDASVFGPFLGF